MDITAFIVVFIICCVGYVVWSKWIYKYRVHEIVNDGTQLFTDLPPGTKFKYLDGNRVWMILESNGKTYHFGLVTLWKEGLTAEKPYPFYVCNALSLTYLGPKPTKIRKLEELRVIVVD